MKTLLVSALLLVGSWASAHSYTTDMTCAEAKALVRSSGAIVLYTSADIYDRYVVSQYYCSMGEYTKPAWVPTSNRSHCFIGYTCENEDRGG